MREFGHSEAQASSEVDLPDASGELLAEQEATDWRGCKAQCPDLQVHGSVLYMLQPWTACWIL